MRTTAARKNTRHPTETGISTVPRNQSSLSASRNLFSRWPGTRKTAVRRIKQAAEEGHLPNTLPRGRASVKTNPWAKQQTLHLGVLRAEPPLGRLLGYRLPPFHIAARVLRQLTKADPRALPNSLFSLSARTSMPHPVAIDAHQLAANQVT